MLVRAAALGGGPGATDRDPCGGRYCTRATRRARAALLAAPGARSLDGLARGNERVLQRRSDAMPLDVGAPRPRGTDPAEHLGFDPARTGAVPAEHVVGAASVADDHPALLRPVEAKSQDLLVELELVEPAPEVEPREGP